MYYYYDALMPLSDWPKSEIEKLNERNIDVYEFNVDKYPHQPDMKISSPSKQSLIDFINEIHQENADEVLPTILQD